MNSLFKTLIQNFIVTSNCLLKLMDKLWQVIRFFYNCGVALVQQHSRVHQNYQKQAQDFSRYFTVTANTFCHIKWIAQI